MNFPDLYHLNMESSAIQYTSTRVQSSNGVTHNTRNYGNYPYGNYVGNAPAGTVITSNT